MNVNLLSLIVLLYLVKHVLNVILGMNLMVVNVIEKVIYVKPKIGIFLKILILIYPELMYVKLVSI